MRRSGPWLLVVQPCPRFPWDTRLPHTLCQVFAETVGMPLRWIMVVTTQVLASAVPVSTPCSCTVVSVLLCAAVMVTCPEQVDAEVHSPASTAVKSVSVASSFPCLQPDFNESMVIPLAQMPYSQAGQTYVVLERAGGALAFGKFANTLNFTVKEIDPTTGTCAACPCKLSAPSLLTFL